MKADPQDEHRWLSRMLGEWEVTYPMPGGETGRAREHVRSLAGLWMLAEGEGEMPGGFTMQSVMTLGYDPARARFTGTWVGSMMTHMWVYDGALDEKGRVLTLDCEGPDFDVPGRVTRYQDIITLVDDDHRTLDSRMVAPDGSWRPVMHADYVRVAKGA